MFWGVLNFYFLFFSFLFLPLLERYFILCAESSSNHTSLPKTRFLQHRLYLLRLYPQTMRLSLQTKRVCLNHSCLSSNCAFLFKLYMSLLKLHVMCFSSNDTLCVSPQTTRVSAQTTLLSSNCTSLFKLLLFSDHVRLLKL